MKSPIPIHYLREIWSWVKVWFRGFIWYTSSHRYFYLVFIYYAPSTRTILDVCTDFKPTETFQYTHVSSCYHTGVRKIFYNGQVLTLFRPGFFLLPWTGGGLRRPYPCNAATAYWMTPQFTPNDVVIISSI